MIGVVDCWTDTPPPPGAADDDELLAAAACDAAVVIGDRGAPKRAADMGVRVVSHVAVSPGPRFLIRRRLRKLIGDPVCVPLSIWSAGVLERDLWSSASDPEIQPAAPRSPMRPFVLPIASEPGRIDACTLVMASALIEAGGGRCLIGLPTGLAQLGRARRRLAAADRILPIEALPLPAPRYIASADLVLDLGITPGGTIDSAVASSGTPSIDALEAATPLSVASRIVEALTRSDKA